MLHQQYKINQDWRCDNAMPTKYKHSPFDEDMVDLMKAYNDTNQTSEKFNLIDARIMSLIRSYDFSDQTFFASNQYLAEQCFTTAATIQKSINKLYSHDLIKKNVCCVNGIKKRILIYNADGVKKFADMVAAPQATII